MIQIKIDQNNNGLKVLINQLSSEQLNKASVRAINVAIRKAKTRYKKEVSRVYNIPFRNLEDTKERGMGGSLISSNNARYSNLRAEVIGIGRPISFTRFAKKFSKKGVEIEIKRGRKFLFPSAFKIKSNKHPTLANLVWSRGKYQNGNFAFGKERMPIDVHRTASPYRMMKNSEKNAQIQQTATSDLEVEFTRQIKLFIARRK